MSISNIPDEFQTVLRAHLPYADSGELSESDELASLGLDSMGIVRLMVALEDRYDVELPDDILNEDTFATVGSLWRTLSDLLPGVDADARVGTADANAAR